MAEKGASESKGSKAKAKTSSKAAGSPVASGKGSRSTTKAAPDRIDSGKRNGNRRTIGIIVGVLVVLALCCLCTLAVLWFTGDSIVDLLRSF